MNKWFDWRPPRGEIAFLAACFVLASSYFIITGGDSWFTHWVCPFFLPIGIGLWLKRSWARWVTFAFFTFVLVLLVTLFYRQGFTVRRVFQGLLIAGTLISLWNWNVYSEDTDAAPKNM